jgi:hypothetical protein
MSAYISSRAQQTLKLDSICHLMADSLPQEKVYLQLDRDKYMSGDTIWFKAYLTAGGFPADFSTGLHVELFDPAGSLIQQKYYPVLKGKISLGDLELKNALSRGLYTIRAYTSYMSNFDEGLFYHYTFLVYPLTPVQPAGKNAKGGYADAGSLATGAPGPGAGLTTAASSTVGAAVSAASTAAATPGPGPRLDIQFLPEGGDVVTNVTTTVAFRAVDTSGLPVTVSGKVVDDLDTLAAEFTTQHDGMGAFSYTPLKGRTYTAIVKTPYGGARIAMPEPKPDGVVLNIQSAAGGIGFVLRADSLSRYLGQTLTVAATMYGQMMFRAKTQLTPEATETGGFIPTAKLSTGVLTVTLFGQDGTPLAERLVFIRSGDMHLTADLTYDTLNLTEKGYNAWVLHVPDSTRGYVSVSVTDADVYTPTEYGSSILSGLWLDGEIRGPVYHPGWYFKDDSDSTQSDLDLVMMTQGWRRYDWAAMEQGHFPALPFSDKSLLTFQGRAFNESGKKLLTNTMVNVFIKATDSTKRMMFTQIDSAGNFFMDGLFFFDTAIAYFQLNKSGNAAQNVQLKLNSPPSFSLDPSERKGIAFPELSVDSAFVGNGEREANLLATFKRLENAKELKEIVIHGHRKDSLQIMDEHYTSGLFSNGTAYQYDLVSDNTVFGYTDILSYLQGRVPGLEISGAYPKMTVKYRANQSFTGSAQPALFLDEIPVTLDALETIPVSNIAYVKVIHPPFVGAEGGGGHGAIAVYTRRGGDQLANEPGLNQLNLPGYARFRDYYTPVYTPGDTGPSSMPDYRITLDWLPYVFAGPGVDSIPIRFYNNNNCRSVRIIAEGIDENGHLLHMEKVIHSAVVNK